MCDCEVVGAVVCVTVHVVLWGVRMLVHMHACLLEQIRLVCPYGFHPFCTDFFSGLHVLVLGVVGLCWEWWACAGSGGPVLGVVGLCWEWWACAGSSGPVLGVVGL